MTGDVQQNGHTTAEIQDEMPLTNMSSKRHSSQDKLHFPRNNLQAITTLGKDTLTDTTHTHTSSFTAIVLNEVERLCDAGKGEFGDVLLAKATAGDGADEEETVVMVKSLQTRDEHVQVEFRRECDMFAKLSHANVARLLGICRDMEPHYMIMEYTDMVMSFHICHVRDLTVWIKA